MASDPSELTDVLGRPSEIKPYYEDEFVTLYNADSLENPHLWTIADVLVTDPPYGISWDNHWDDSKLRRHIRPSGSRHVTIHNDDSLESMERALGLWGSRKPYAVFTTPKSILRQATQILVWWKDDGSSGAMGQIAHWRRDWEAICLGGHWQDRPTPGPLSSSVIRTTDPVTAQAKDLNHPTPKPVALMERILEHCEPGWVVCDPFAGTGSTLLAARNLGFHSIGIELDRDHCETAAKRLSQGVFDLGEVA